MTKRLSYYKQYAKRCLLAGRIGTRAYDNCFENGQGDEVVRYLMAQASYATPEKVAQCDKWLSQGVTHGTSEYKEYRKVYESKRVADAIKRTGNWDYWQHFVKHGTYEGV